MSICELMEDIRATLEKFYEAGDIVYIRPEWDGDRTPFIVKEWNKDRGIIAPLHWDEGGIRPQELVTEEMIQS
jgi:hypothetical protein